MGDEASGVVLIGMRRAGKTVVGSALALRLGRIFIDTDRLVRAREGRSPAEIIAADGEERFRDVEADAVATAVQRGGAVIATGGGAVLRAPSVATLRDHGCVIYLHVEIDELAARAARDPRPASRPPLVPGGGGAEEGTLYGRRDPLYRGAAHHVVEAADPVAMVVERCLHVISL